jgi:hypothetical protein
VIAAPSQLPPEEDGPDTGSAVVDGNIRFLSPSQIVQADSRREGGCLKRWWWQKPMHKKELSSDAQEAGKLDSRVIAHYLKTGEDVMRPEVRAMKHLLPKWGPDLEVEEQLGDIERAVKMRDAILSGARMPAGFAERLPVEIERSAGVVMEGIPFRGAADVRHFRGVYKDETGELREEAPGNIVAEIGDHKGTSRIADYRSRGGTGKLYQGYAMTADKIGWHPQWLTYGVHAAFRHPELTHVRLAAHYYQTKNALYAEKRMVLLEVGEVRERHRMVVLPVVREMVDVAKVKDQKDVPYNNRSCTQFGKPCPHSDYCERDKGDIYDLFGIDKQQGETMGFEDIFGGDDATPQKNGVPAIPAASDAEHAAQVAAHRAKLAADAAPAAVTYGFCASCGEKLDNGNASRLPNGTIKHIGCAAPDKTVAGPSKPHIGLVNPADSPVPDILLDAAALPPGIIDEIEDPEIKRRAVEHAAAVAAKKAAEEAAKPAAEKKTGGRCPNGGQKMVMTRQESSFRKMKCSCGKLFEKIKDDKLAFENDEVFFVVPTHNLPKPAEGEPAQTALPTKNDAPIEAAPAIPDIVDEAPPSLPDDAAPELPDDLLVTSTPNQEQARIIAEHELARKIAIPPGSPLSPVFTDETGGTTVFVDVFFDDDSPPLLDTYYLDLVHQLEAAGKVRDIRHAPDKHDLGFGRWRGALAAAVKACPPPAGSFVARGYGSDEILTEVVNALRAMGARMAWGGGRR